MFWKFGFHNASSIDSLLDKEDVSLEAIMDEDDLLQECKSQNTRLIAYFQRVDVLQRLLGYVTGQIEIAERGRFKYPYVATEVLCSEIWSVVETCVNNPDHLLAPFWETVLDRSPEDMKTQMVMASHFTKINTVFLNKKPAEMLAFIQSQPSVVERILGHIETPSFVDLLVRIIQLDETPSGAGVLEWLSSENLMGRLIEMLSPSHPSDMHTVVAEVIKGIISLAAPSPGTGLTEGLQNGPASNRFARELAHRDSVLKLADYMLYDFDSAGPASHDQDSCRSPSETSPPPNLQSCTSSVIHSISIIIELIRKNNSDYFEPYLFHTLRNRLIQVQQHLQTHTEDGRETLEQAMKEMVDRMGVVHLGGVLNIISERLDSFQRYLRHPRSLVGPIPTTIGAILPLTFERYRICELYAELLHCSNMSLLNRSPEYNHLYDSEGRLQGGLSALEELAQVIAIGSGEQRDRETMDENNDEIEPALELPVTTSSHDSPSLLDSDEDMSDGDDSDDDTMEEIAMYDDAIARKSQNVNVEDAGLSNPQAVASSPPNAASPLPTSELSAEKSALFPQRHNSRGQTSSSGPSTPEGQSHGSRRNSGRTPTETSLDVLPAGEKLKQKFLDMNVLSTLLDLFFEFPWNNFLHSVVYDLVHQILTGRVDCGRNRELTIALFRDSRLMHRIVEGQKHNDIESAKPKGVRLGYMGHLTLISEDIIAAMQHYPADLRLIIVQLAPYPDWDDYVNGRFSETKRRDSSLLGGGKPIIAAGATRPTAHWKVDEEDANPATTVRSGNGVTTLGGPTEVKGEFRRTGSVRPSRESSADFSSPSMSDDDHEGNRGPQQFAQYLAQEMQSPNHFGSEDASDEDEDDGGWLSQSTFDLRNPPVVPRNGHNVRRPLASNGFDDAFVPTHSSEMTMSVNPFGSHDDDEAFGSFTDSAAASGADPFIFSSFSEDIDDTTFDGFADFGDFQVANEGELTPTAESGSWSFASISDETSSDGSGSEPAASGQEQPDGTSTVQSRGRGMEAEVAISQK